MDDRLKYPDMEAAASIFRKLGIEPVSRFSAGDQDFEYTSCEVSELEKYLGLYLEIDTSDMEKRVLGCFFLECLNDYVSTNNSAYPKHSDIMKLLHNDLEIHESELEYWTNTKDPIKEHWWPITEYILEWRGT
jgi:hypothetical protein